MNFLIEKDFTFYRNLLLKMHYDAGVGHVGGNLSAIDSMLIVFNEFLKKNDKFVLSKGHSAGALYICLYSIGLLSIKDLNTFHTDNTRLAGHPQPNISKFTPFATGSLGHGFSIACGLAKSLQIKNKLNANIFCYMSDGEWQEGSTWEAFLFFIKHNLYNLIPMIDINGLQGFGKTKEISCISDFKRTLSGFSIKLIECDGHNPKDIRYALKKAISLKVPSIILLKTIKGRGVKGFDGQMESHYLPLNNQQLLEFNS